MRNLALIVVILVSTWSDLYGQEVAPFDIIISELMIDPSPTVGLPNFEWIELYNRTQEPINLEDLLYSSGATRYALPMYTLNPGAFVMLCDDSDISELSAFGETIAMNTFPTLTNTGDAATLENENGALIHEVIYAKSWYGDTDKDDGGYTLEIINPNDPCLGASNWIASDAQSGATPAAQNSNWNPSTAVAGLNASEVFPGSPNELVVSFDRIPNASLSEMDFSITPAINIVDIVPDDDNPRLVSLILSETLNPGTFYTLTIDGQIEDCIGLSSGREQVLDFLLPESVDVGDLLINEILFNPVGTESDYVEVFNSSDKTVDIRQLMIGNLDPSGSGSSETIGESYLLSPRDYIVFTEDAAALVARYPLAISSKILEVDLPSFNNADGNVTLWIDNNGAQLMIDAFDYEEAMHNESIDDTEGVALERVDQTVSASERSNWQSGASSSGYGSPTLPNPQRNTPSGVGFVALEQKTFFPEKQMDNLLNIFFTLDRSDFLGTIDIFDSVGRMVYQLANNQLIGRSDQYQWDGRDSQGTLMKAGIYIIHIQLVASDGELVTKKLPCVLSRSL